MPPDCLYTQTTHVAHETTHVAPAAAVLAVTTQSAGSEASSTHTHTLAALA